MAHWLMPSCMILFHWEWQFLSIEHFANRLFRNQPAKLDTQRWFLQYMYIRGAVLGRHVGHDSCCCSAVSQPANGLSKLVSAIGRCGISFVFFRASVRNVRDLGRCAGKACWARILLLFGRFGTSQWTVKAGFCNG